jgi:ATP adenylyltransferase
MRTSSGQEPGCTFCDMPAASTVAGNALAYAVRDVAPAAPLHTMVLPRRHVPDYFDLTSAEREAMTELLLECRRDIAVRDPAVAGFNIGINIGAAAGQTIFHCHIHLVPRRTGDGEAVVTSGPRKRLLARLPPD